MNQTNLAAKERKERTEKGKIIDGKIISKFEGGSWSQSKFLEH